MGHPEFVVLRLKNNRGSFDCALRAPLRMTAFLKRDCVIRGYFCSWDQSFAGSRKRLVMGV